MGRHLSCGHKHALTKQMLRGLIKLHSWDIPHRNMNPYNIFLTNRGILKLGVFGADPGENSWNTLYRAPEQHLGLPYTKKVDLWALAVILTLLKPQPEGRASATAALAWLEQ